MVSDLVDAENVQLNGDIKSICLLLKIIMCVGMLITDQHDSYVLSRLLERHMRKWFGMM